MTSSTRALRLWRAGPGDGQSTSFDTRGRAGAIARLAERRVGDGIHVRHGGGGTLEAARCPRRGPPACAQAAARAAHHQIHLTAECREHVSFSQKSYDMPSPTRSAGLSASPVPSSQSVHPPPRLPHKQRATDPDGWQYRQNDQASTPCAGFPCAAGGWPAAISVLRYDESVFQPDTPADRLSRLRRLLGGAAVGAATTTGSPSPAPSSSASFLGQNPSRVSQKEHMAQVEEGSPVVVPFIRLHRCANGRPRHTIGKQPRAPEPISARWP
ncbi:hypothetical protein CDD83_10880 [Cordyceps sp. RAO-2017]|nr:hypothetical protein CDD83_10880 [Cordyceps sp. RAO-2017]